MKGLILAGGVGSRLRPITHTSAKQLVPIANKPILFYGIEQMADVDILDIAIVVSPETGDEIRAAVGDGSSFGLSVTYISQPEPLGIAHGVKLAREYLGNDEFVLYLGDNMLEQGLREFVAEFHAERDRHPELGEEHRPLVAAHILLAAVDDPRQMGVAELDPRGEIIRLIEKPKVPPSKYALVGVYLFGPEIHDAVLSIAPSARGELEITDAIQWLIDSGHRVHHQILSGWWIDTGKKDPLLECNRLVLDTLDGRVDGRLDKKSKVEGRVVIEAGATLKNSTVRGPAIIGANTQLVDTYVGPYTSIGPDCELTDCDIEFSVVLENSRIVGVHRIKDSLLGRSVEVTRTSTRPKATRLTLGDHSQAELE